MNDTYIDGYGVERKQVSPIESAINTVKNYLGSLKSNYKDLVETPGVGLLYPETPTEVALMAVPITKIGNATSALARLEKMGCKVDGKLLTKQWFKDMACGSNTGQGGQLTKAAKEAKRTFAEAKQYGLSNNEAGEMAASRFRYILDKIDETFVFKQGGKIHIKEENEGKFARSAKAAGESVQEHARKVLSDPNATALQKKRANFARNAAKWHK
jgi:hypothetical protein